MRYEPLINPDNIQRSANPIASLPSVNRVLIKFFQSDILPSRSSHPRQFARDEVDDDLYTDQREWRDAVDFSPEGAERHEKYLDQVFWDPMDSSRILCVIGPVGSGKSTLVDYYLRCYLPSSSSQRDGYDAALIVNFDSRVIQDNTDFYHLFFLQAQSSIRHQCLMRSFEIDRLVSRRPTHPNNIREWVWAALEELSRIAEGSAEAAPFRYIVVVVDNLDQTPPAVQIRAITEVEQWCRNPLIRLWRVIIPLWPSTFASLKNHRFNMLRGVRSFHIGPVQRDVLVGHLEAAIASSRTLPSSSRGAEVTRYLAESLGFAWNHLSPRLLGLSHGNLRHLLFLLQGVIESESMYEVWRQRQSSTSRTHEYELLDALIVGGQSALDRRNGRIANVFSLTDGFREPRDLMLGPHLLSLLAGGVKRRHDLSQVIDALGYARDRLDHALGTLFHFQALHEILDPYGKGDFETHDTVTSAYVGYLGLIWEPAYIDNVAMVTPVDDTLLRWMRRTRGSRVEDFSARVETSLHFLRFLRQCEESFCDPAALRPEVDPDGVAAAVREHHLPCYWRKIALRYAERLLGLRHSGYMNNLDPRWWDFVLSSTVLVDAGSTAEQ